MTKPEDGGSLFVNYGTALPVGESPNWPTSSGVSQALIERKERLGLAAQFAAAWLPILHTEIKGIIESKLEEDKAAVVVIDTANELGLAMADDLLRRLKEKESHE